MDSAQIQRLREEVEPKVIEILNSSNLAELLQEHGISAREAISLEVKVDTTKIETRAVVGGQELQKLPLTIGGEDVALTIGEKKIVLATVEEKIVVFRACAGPCPGNPKQTCWGPNFCE